MKKGWIIAGVVALIIVVAGVGVYRQVSAESPSVSTVTMKEEKLSSTIMVPGTLEIKEKQIIYPTADQREIKDIPVKEGQAVKKDDVLITYENDQLEMEKEQNQNAINSSYLQINQVDKKIDRLNEKENELADQVGEEEASEQIEEQRDQLDYEKQMANNDLKQNLLQKEMLEKRKADLKVNSNISGTVLKKNEQQNATSMENADPIIYVANLSSMIVTGTLSEYDTLKVKDGQKVTISSDAYPDKTWEGKVATIGTLPEQSSQGLGNENQAVQYPVEVSVSSKSMELKPGFQLTMEIETESKQATTLPVTAVKQEGEENFVYLLKDGKASKQQVEIGLATGDKLEIIKGINKEDKVMEDPPSNVADGMEVKES
ncbi:efflux RND transporter periplasmic adaptor subunit [Pontibacillus salicampi]|uniref:Efflux RND transporter periplasmic adaptor subunit n=1 Tax=Pontibacillus salicampi TaxID=1449801 RepID=A0ABV6LQB3_9BACI